MGAPAHPRLLNQRRSLSHLSNREGPLKPEQAHAPSLFAKLCGVDLRSGVFANGVVAQTSVARLNAIIIREDLGATLHYHLLPDSASAAYLWACLNDAMTEFAGAPVGLAALRRHLAGDGPPHP